MFELAYLYLKMPNKYLVSFFSFCALALSAFPAYGQLNSTAAITFSCDEDRDIPVTLAKNKAGKTQTIFNWKPEAFPQRSNTVEICRTVSQKLDNYAAKSNLFPLFAIQPTEQAGLPAICATQTGFSCDLVLLTLSPAEEPVTIACETLVAIIDRKIDEPIQDTTRSMQPEQLFTISLFPNEQ